MGYWKSKVLPKIKKVFGANKPAAEAEKPAEEVTTVRFGLLLTHKFIAKDYNYSSMCS